MGFDELASELHRSAEAEGRKIAEAAEKAAGKVVGEAQDRAADSIKAAKKEAAELSEQESSERVTSARLAAKKILDEARDHAVEQTLREAWGKYKSAALRRDAYSALLSRLVKEGAGELGSAAGSITVYCRAEDAQLLAGYRVARLPAEYSGGAIVESQDGRVRVNRTLEEEFAQKKPLLRKQIYDKLF
jgi:vacuolar-type H+-ATPase subunit E/Vma4